MGHILSSVTRKQRPGQLIRQKRTDLGLSPEDLAYAIFKAGNGEVSGRTIRRIEDPDICMVPRVRARFAIASFFDLSVTDIWPLEAPARKKVAA